MLVSITLFVSTDDFIKFLEQGHWVLSAAIICFFIYMLQLKRMLLFGDCFHTNMSKCNEIPTASKLKLMNIIFTQNKVTSIVNAAKLISLLHFYGILSHKICDSFRQNLLLHCGTLLLTMIY